MLTITLPTTCDRSAIAALLPDMANAAKGPVMVEGSQVEKAGQALLQLLVSLKKTQPQAMILPSPALRAIAQSAALDRLLFDEVDA